MLKSIKEFPTLYTIRRFIQYGLANSSAPYSPRTDITYTFAFKKKKKKTYTLRNKRIEPIYIENYTVIE